MIGKTVSHYQILEKLGEGGMGIVYKALDLKLERHVALKFLPHEISVGPEDRARFLQEARAASAISHANVCVIHDIVEHDGQQFIVMEYVDGKTLRQLVPIQKVQDALGYAIQVGEALQEAHARGIVHRDIKTDNIMVNANNQVRVMDFGLAKLRGSLKLTRTTSTVGTLSYMAPEQIQGGEVDVRSDIFSFGVVLYEMLTGQMPFVGEHEAAVMYSIVNESPQPVQKFRPDLSSEVLHIINRALEKDPEDRYQTVREMVIDLRRAKKETSKVSRPVFTSATAELGRLVPEKEEARPGEGTVGQQVTAVGGTPAEVAATVAGTGGAQAVPGIRGPAAEPAVERTSKRQALFLPKTLTWIGLGGIVVVLAAIAIFVVLPRRAPRLNPDMSFRTIEVPFVALGYPGLSPDGRWFAFTARDAKTGWSVYFMNVAGGVPRRLVTESFNGFDYAEVSPDGSEVLFGAYQEDEPRSIYVVSSLGGKTRKIAELGAGARWRPDGQLIGYVRTGAYASPSESGRREFWTVRPDGSDTQLQFVDSVSYVYSGFCFDWSPDGKSVAWVKTLPGYGELFVRDLKSGRERQLTFDKAYIDEAAWAPNDWIFFTSGKSGNSNIWMIPASGGETIQVTKGTGPDYGVRVSADGKRLLYLELRRTHRLWTVDIDGRNARQLTFDSQALAAPCFSPDNKRISFDVYSSDPLRTGSHVFVMDSDGSNRAQLTSGNAEYYVSSWSPDGKYMTYSARQPGEPFDSTRLYLVEASNPSTKRLIGKGMDALWISNEEFVSFTGLPHTHSVLYSIQRREPLEVAQDSTWRVPLHDGKHVLMWDMRKGREGWYVKRVGAGQDEPARQIVPREYYNSSWPSVSIRYLLSRQANGEMWRISLPDGKRERLSGIINGINPYEFQIRTSYDDKYVVYLKPEPDSRVILIENLFK
jgi:Tol biopolymer transport system component/predicted Ser/Thr protein kinase